MITLAFSAGSSPSPLPDGPHVGGWVIEYDKANACGNAVMGMGRCTEYVTNLPQGRLNVQAIGLPRSEADAVVESIPLQSGSLFSN